MMFDQPTLYLDAEHYSFVAPESKQALAEWFDRCGVDLKTCREMWFFENEVLLILIDLDTSKRWKQILTSWRVVPAGDLPDLVMPQDVARRLNRIGATESEGSL